MRDWGFSGNIQKVLPRVLLAVSLLATLFGTTAYAQPSAGRPPFRYGIIVSNPGNYSEVAKLGFGYVKLYAGWNGMEPNPGPVGNFPDNAVLLAHANNVQIVMTIFDTPGWATCSGSYNPNNPPPCSSNPNHMGDFGTFMGALAAHYKGQVAAYEIWNEENVNGTWGNQSPDVPTYFSMLQAAYTNVKAADPTALVISGGLANTLNGNPGTTISDLTYIQQLLGMGGASYLDAIGIHPYPGACDPTATSCPQTPGAYFQRAAEDHNAAVGAGFPNVPFWITEAGYFSPPGNIDPNAASCPAGGNTGIGGFNAYEVDDNTKASWLVQAYQDAYNTMPWLGMFMMMNLDISMDSTTNRAQCDPSRFWAILTSTGQETPAYTALMNMTKETPQMTLPPLSSMQQVAGVVTLNGSVTDPTTTGGSAVDAVIVTIGAPFSPTATQATVTLNPDGTFQASFDTSHLTYNQTALVYVYAHTPSSGWLYGSAGVVPAPQAELSTNSLVFSFTPSQSNKTATQTVNVGRNDGDPGAFAWTVTPSAGASWLSVASTDTGGPPVQMFFTVTVDATSLSPGSYSATITYANSDTTFIKTTTFPIPITVVIGTKPTLNNQIYLPLAPVGPSLSGLPGIP